MNIIMLNANSFYHTLERMGSKLKNLYKCILLLSTIVLMLCSCSSAKTHEDNINQGKNTPDIVAITPSPTATYITPSPTPELPKRINMRFAGDTIFETHVSKKIDSMGIEAFTSEISPFLKNTDIAMLNLETPLSLRGEKEKDKQFNFRGKPEYIEILKASGIDIVSLANNHILDYGLDALNDTIEILNKNSINFVGAGKDINSANKPIYFNKNSIKVAIISSSRVIPFVSWTAGNNYPGVASTYDPSRMVKEIKSTRNEADIVICYVHWGEELKTLPVEHQKVLARTYIDNGADLVIGSHPHILQGFEFYKNKLICYSLGNFIFTDFNKDTALLDVTVEKKQGVQLNYNFKVIPFEIKEFHTKYMNEVETVQKLYKNLEEVSFGVKIREDGTILPR